MSWNLRVLRLALFPYDIVGKHTNRSCSRNLSSVLENCQNFDWLLLSVEVYGIPRRHIILVQGLFVGLNGLNQIKVNNSAGNVTGIRIV